jgi:dihydropteroate synthase
MTITYCFWYPITMLYCVTGREAKERDVASGIAAGVCLWEGANIIRMHNASVGRDAVRLVDALRHS